jgi:hypothetical protein
MRGTYISPAFPKSPFVLVTLRTKVIDSVAFVVVVGEAALVHVSPGHDVLPKTVLPSPFPLARVDVAMGTKSADPVAEVMEAKRSYFRLLGNASAESHSVSWPRLRPTSNSS